MNTSPHVINMASPNGAGKTTSAQVLLRSMHMYDSNQVEKLLEMVRKDEPHYLKFLQ